MEPVSMARSKVNAQFRHNAGSSVLPKVSLDNIFPFFLVSAKLLLGQMETRKSDPAFP